jgi:hypothetical protein
MMLMCLMLLLVATGGGALTYLLSSGVDGYVNASGTRGLPLSLASTILLLRLIDSVSDGSAAPDLLCVLASGVTALYSNDKGYVCVCVCL